MHVEEMIKYEQQGLENQLYVNRNWNIFPWCMKLCVNIDSKASGAAVKWV